MSGGVLRRKTVGLSLPAEFGGFESGRRFARNAAKGGPSGFDFGTRNKCRQAEARPTKTCQMIVNRQRRVLIAVQPLHDFYERARRELRFSPESITVQLISDAAMARLNRTYRNKEGPTDVLSFPASRGKSRHIAEYVGDIAISPETARRNARRFSRSLAVEMRILILHGMIHLAGFDHENDHGEMDRLERRLRRRLGVATGVVSLSRTAKRFAVAARRGASKR
jgi:probable rRNA maturation factor